jgi:hypothetical protein
MRSTLRLGPARFTSLKRWSCFNDGWNKPNFLFDNHQQGGMGQNFNRSEPSLKDTVRDQLRINSEVGRKLVATDKILESIDSRMNNFTMVVQN